MSRIITLFGPTASGKTDFALRLTHALQLRGCKVMIINADSKQVYQGIPIITAQPSKEEQQRYSHALYGHTPPSVHYNVSHWLKEVVPKLTNLLSEGTIPILVGGTGLYFKCLIEGIVNIPAISEDVKKEVCLCHQKHGTAFIHTLLQTHDPESFARLSPNDTTRVLRAYEVLLETTQPLSHWQTQPKEQFFAPEQFISYCLLKPREELYQACNMRFEQMLKCGAFEEVRMLERLQLNPLLPAMKAHGVPELIAYFNQAISLKEATEKAQQVTRNYIKRQHTWAKHQMKEAQMLYDTSNAVIEAVCARI